jgi:hypothetical protein
MEPPSSSKHIDKEADQLLRKANALWRFPTPVEDIIAAQRLRVSAPEDSPLAPGMIARAPAALQAKLRSAMFKVLAAIDRRERVIHVNSKEFSTNHDRFSKLHEVGHDLCPWQDLSYAVDGLRQFDHGTTVLFEREANYAGARLLFQGEVFSQAARDYATGMASIVDLATKFGSSIHAAFHQYVCTHRDGVAGYVLARRPANNPFTGSLHFSVQRTFSSATFGATYAPLSPRAGGYSSDDHEGLEHAWSQLQSGDGVGISEVIIRKLDGSAVVANAELFSNGYNLFLLVYPSRKRLLVKKVRIATKAECAVLLK